MSDTDGRGVFFVIVVVVLKLGLGVRSRSLGFWVQWGWVELGEMDWDESRMGLRLDYKVGLKWMGLGGLGLGWDFKVNFGWMGLGGLGWMVVGLKRD